MNTITGAIVHILESLGTDNGGKQNHLSVLHTGRRIHYLILITS